MGNLSKEEIAAELQIGVDMYEKLVQMFFDQAESQMAQTKEAIEANDVKGAIEPLHSMKGSSGSLKLESVYVLCKEMEEDAKTTGNLNVVSARYQDLQTAITDEKSRNGIG